jgi:predicted ATPase
MSHGESFFALLNNRSRDRGLYFLDEPDAGLSPTRQLAVLVRIHQLTSKGAQFIIATHSPLLLAYPAATILQLGEGRIRTANYEETENVRVYRNFLRNPARSLALLFR